MNILLLILIMSYFSCRASEIEFVDTISTEDVILENNVSITDGTVPTQEDVISDPTTQDLEMVPDVSVPFEESLPEALLKDTADAVSEEALEQTPDTNLQKETPVENQPTESIETISIETEEIPETAILQVPSAVSSEVSDENLTEVKTALIATEAIPAISELTPEYQTLQPESVDSGKSDDSLELSEPLGIDTMNLSEPQGNWLFKRVWWERAEERYEKINQLVQKIMEIRVNFFVKRADLDKKVLDPFYLAVGMGNAELVVTLTTLIEQIEKEREDDGALSLEQRELLETIEQEHDAVGLLQKDIQIIEDLDHSVDEALAKLIEVMNEIRQHERIAWVNFKEISRVLSEKKARELFYNIDASWQHIKKLRDYLENEFGPYFTKLTKNITEHIAVVQKEIDELKKKGIDLKQSVDILTQKKEKPLNLYDDEDEDNNDAPKTSWFGWFGSMLWNIITFPITLIKRFFKLFF